jgi:SAM-dependent methyltransferase
MNFLQINMNSKDPDDQRATTQFYEDRYSRGYMEEWPVEKKQRVFQIIQELELPETGRALDFGCGNGVFTDLVRQALPRTWAVHGCDISAVAIDNARTRYQKCHFFVSKGLHVAGEKYDFVFSHHVLEHVLELRSTLDQIASLIKEDGIMLHVLPCGNAGSLEHWLSSLRTDGIDHLRGNRFFFEDPGHVRRLTSEELTAELALRGCDQFLAYFSGQYWGALDWMASSAPSVILEMSKLSLARNASARRDLLRHSVRTIVLWMLRFPGYFVESRIAKYRASNRLRAREVAALLLFLPLYIGSKPIDLYLKAKARGEWSSLRREQNGSEMYLGFVRRRVAGRQIKESFGD